MNTTDEELVRAYNSGESKAFEALFNRHKAQVFNFALRLLNNRPDAEDVSSEVFLALFNKRFVPDGRAKLTTWLLTVARNACLSRLRSVKHTVSLWFKKDGDDIEWDIPDTAKSPQEQAIDHENKKLIALGLQKLPDEQREALVLREYMDKDYYEIAEILGCSLDKVKVLIFRGREALRKEVLPRLREQGL
jgi:RNA polymerase sigma-70 factor (ECF subfamily)